MSDIAVVRCLACGSELTGGLPVWRAWLRHKRWGVRAGAGRERVSANRVECACGWVAPAAVDGPGPVVELLEHRAAGHVARVLYEVSAPRWRWVYCVSCGRDEQRPRDDWHRCVRRAG